MFRTIMVPLDGSVVAEQALPFAVTLAQRTGARIHLTHVLDVFSRPDYTKQMSAYEYWNGGALEAAQKYLKQTAERLRANRSGLVSFILRQGEITPELLKEVTATTPDLVVMTTHGLGGYHAGWIGSVADRMMRQCTRPVLLLRAARAQDTTIDHVLVALDGSSLSEQVLEPAARLATVTGARVTLLSIARPQLAPISVLAGMAGPEIEEQSLSFRPDDDDVEYLEHAARGIAQYEIDTETHVVVTHTPPGTAILRYAELSDAACIALATRGRGRVARWLLGSVADKVVRNAPCAVLVCAPDEVDDD